MSPVSNEAHLLKILDMFLNCRRSEETSPMLLLVFLFCFVLFLSFSRDAPAPAPVASGGSQAKGLIGAVAAGLHHSHSHSHARSEPRLRPTPQLRLHHSSGRRRILNPLSEAKDRTRNLLVPSGIR